MEKNSKESIWIVLLNLINIYKINLNNYESMFIETDGMDKLINQLKQQKIETKMQNSEGIYIFLENAIQPIDYLIVKIQLQYK